MKKLLLVILFFISTLAAAQEADIVPALKYIEQGDLKSAEKFLANLKSTRSADPSVMFLDAVLTQNGDEAIALYGKIYNNYPNSKYADASLYRIFSFYYSLGYYKKASDLLVELKSKYPASPYIKMADRTIPSEEIAAEDTSKISSEKNQTPDFKFTIQAGAFLNPANAKVLKEKFESDGYHSELSTKEVGGTILNVVTVGLFKTEDETSELLSVLEKKYNLKGRVVTINK